MVAPHASQGGRRPPNLQKKCVYIYIYIFAIKNLYAKLTYFNHSNKNVECSDLKITKIWIQQK